MKIKRIVMLSGLLLVAINIFLIVSDHDGVIERKSYVKDWAKVEQKDMMETLNTKGILTSTAKQHLYFDREHGSFQTFLVNEGDEVSEGDELYTYQVHHYESAVSRLEQSIHQLEEDIQALETILSSIHTYTIDEIPSIQIKQADDEIVEINRPPVDAEWMKYQYTLEIEKELALKEAELTSLEAQLTSLETTGQTVTVTSPYAGVVTMISASLDDPLMTIETMDLHIEGELGEQDRPLVEAGMTVDIYVPAVDQMFEGTVEKITQHPDQAQSHESVYRYYVTFSEEAELDQLLAGYHTDLRVVTKESLKAKVINDKAIFDGEIWLMTDDGVLKSQPVNMGIHMGEWQEITDGVDFRQIVAVESPQSFRHGTTFITPLKFKELPLKATLKGEQIDRSRYLLLGLVSR